ncbi:hypothetical protein OZX72_07045 [Bifidobacterium sp. ESL0769]|uniref:hypothetical protein n=1 Tax=Bifidobacterium sp. ESL0769 TaxID=2983229 RepID=UPI0023F6AB7C|nr:hypothetical protein [Bifidobacterium sp. ESL0769]WEV67000.1 hypothetical protein OZX72_07045 [Bifidobacterium sp. ESL0769]
MTTTNPSNPTADNDDGSVKNSDAGSNVNDTNHENPETHENELDARMDRLFELLKPFMDHYSWRTLMDEYGGDTVFDTEDKRMEADLAFRVTKIDPEPDMPQAKRIICISPEPALKMICIVPKLNGFRIHTLVTKATKKQKPRESKVTPSADLDSPCVFKHEYRHYDIKGEAGMVVLYLALNFRPFLTHHALSPNDVTFASLHDDGFTVYFKDGQGIASIKLNQSESIYYYLRFFSDPRTAQTSLDEARKLDEIDVNPKQMLAYSPGRSDRDSFSFCPPNRGQIYMYGRIHEDPWKHIKEGFTYEIDYVNEDGTSEYISSPEPYKWSVWQKDDIPARTTYTDAVRAFTTLSMLMRSVYELADQLGIKHDANLEDVVVRYARSCSHGMDHMWNVIDHAVTRRRDMATLSALLDERGFEQTELPLGYAPADRADYPHWPDQIKSCGGILITAKDKTYPFHFYLEQVSDDATDIYHCHLLRNEGNVDLGSVNVHGIEAARLYLATYLGRANPGKPTDDPYGEPDHKTLTHKIELYCKRNEGNYNDLANAPEFLTSLVKPQYYSLGKDVDGKVCLTYRQSAKYSDYHLHFACTEGECYNNQDYPLGWDPDNSSKEHYLLAFTLWAWRLQNLYELAARIGIDIRKFSCADVHEILANPGIADLGKDSGNDELGNESEDDKSYDKDDCDKSDTDKAENSESDNIKPDANVIADAFNGTRVDVEAVQNVSNLDEEINENVDKTSSKTQHDMDWLFDNLRYLLAGSGWWFIPDSIVPGTPANDKTETVKKNSVPTGDPVSDAITELTQETAGIQRILCFSPGRKPFIITIAAPRTGNGHVTLSYSLPCKRVTWSFEEPSDQRAEAILRFSSIDKALLFILVELDPLIFVNGLDSKTISAVVKDQEGYQIILCDGSWFDPMPVQKPESLYLYLLLASDPSTADSARQAALHIDDFPSNPQAAIDFLQYNVSPRYFSLNDPKPGAVSLVERHTATPATMASDTDHSAVTCVSGTTSSDTGDASNSDNATDAGQSDTAIYDLVYCPLHSQARNEDPGYLTLLKGTNRPKAICRMALFAYRLQQVHRAAEALDIACDSDDTFIDEQDRQIVSKANDVINLISRWMKIEEQRGEPLARLNGVHGKHKWTTYLEYANGVHGDTEFSYMNTDGLIDPRCLDISYSKEWPSARYGFAFFADPDDPEGILCRIRRQETDRGFSGTEKDVHTVDEVAAYLEEKIER